MTTQFLSPSDLTAACHVRTALVLEPIDAKIETLRACDADGDVDELVVRSWPAEVGLDADGPYHEVIDRFRAFERWADDHDVSVRPPFAIREKTMHATDDAREVLVTPTFCLALYRADRLVGVYPHSDGDDTVTATDAIAALRTGELPPLLGSAPESVADAPARDGTSVETFRPSEGRAPNGGDTIVDTDEETAANSAPAQPGDSRSRIAPASAIGCPDCGAELTNVQGILACTGCDWTDSALERVASPRGKLVYLALLDEPVSIETLARAANMKKLALYSVLETLSDRGLVEETDPDTYRARRREEVATLDAGVEQ